MKILTDLNQLRFKSVFFALIRGIILGLPSFHPFPSLWGIFIIDVKADDFCPNKKWIFAKRKSASNFGWCRDWKHFISKLLYYVLWKSFNGVVGNIIVDDTANAVFIIIKRNETIAIPNLAKNLCAVKGVGVFNAVKLLEFIS